jgi:archaellin
MNNSTSTINLDKLRITLYYDDAVNLYYYLRQSNNLISATRITALEKDKDTYKYTYAFSFKGIQLGILNVGMIVNDRISHLSINNHIFYTNLSLLDEFLVALNQIDIELDPSRVEIALDSDSDAYVKNYNKLKKTNRLVLGKNYVNRNFSEDFRKINL